MVLLCTTDFQVDDSAVERDHSVDVLGIENCASSWFVGHVSGSASAINSEKSPLRARCKLTNRNAIS